MHASLPTYTHHTCPPGPHGPLAFHAYPRPNTRACVVVIGGATPSAQAHAHACQQRPIAIERAFAASALTAASLAVMPCPRPDTPPTDTTAMLGDLLTRHVFPALSATSPDRVAFIAHSYGAVMALHAAAALQCPSAIITLGGVGVLATYRALTLPRLNRLDGIVGDLDPAWAEAARCAELLGAGLETLAGCGHAHEDYVRFGAYPIALDRLTAHFTLRAS